MRLAELAGMIRCRVIPGTWTGKAISHERIMPAMPGQGCGNQERHLESIRFLKREPRSLLAARRPRTAAAADRVIQFPVRRRTPGGIPRA
jgi:hypothetical protein